MSKTVLEGAFLLTLEYNVPRDLSHLPFCVTAPYLPPTSVPVNPHVPQTMPV